MEKQESDGERNLFENSLTWGDLVTLTIIGLWGHDARTELYTFAGAKGHWPDTVYRLSRCGPSSISKDEYMDEFVDLKDCYEGHIECKGKSNNVFRIKKIERRSKLNNPTHGERT